MAFKIPGIGRFPGKPSASLLVSPYEVHTVNGHPWPGLEGKEMSGEELSRVEEKLTLHPEGVLPDLRKYEVTAKPKTRRKLFGRSETEE